MSLKQEIEKMQQAFMPNIPEDIKQIMQAVTDDLLESSLTSKSLKFGDQAPSFSLPNASGQVIKSDDLLKDGPLVLSFYRGGWCPYCNLELQALKEAYPQMKQLGAKLVAISPETPNHSQETSERHALEFEVLSDVGNKVAQEFGLVFALAEELRPIYKQFGFDLPSYNGDESWEIPVPATYVIGRDGKITYGFVNVDYTQRAEPEDIVEALRAYAN
ncbi:MAG: peroxiredoxin-like family protein [Chloroflexota bacterium]|nr:peroxiredoxin-like family protein [Chloroflexota bacterium]